MFSPNSKMARSEVTGGGTSASSASSSLVGSVGEEVVIMDQTSSSNQTVKAGWSEIASFPGTLASLTPRSDIGSSSITVNWLVPGYDGAIGTAQSGSAYLIQVASAGYGGIFANLNSISVTSVTTPLTVGSLAGGTALALDGNTTFYIKVMLRDSDGDVSIPFNTEFTSAATLALPPSTAGTLEFTSIQLTSVTVAWVAPFETGITSKTNEGYVLLASSDNFGAISLPTPAPVFSSATPSVVLSTLTLGGGAVGSVNALNLANTYYFQVGSINWAGTANFTALNRLNFQIVQSTGLLKFTLNPAIALSTVATSSMVVTNVGNWPASVQLTASTATPGGSPWTLSTYRGIEQAVLMGEWYSGALGPPAVGPSAASFATYLTSTTIESSGVNYYGNQSGAQVPAGSNVSLWTYFQLPTSSYSGSEVLAVGVSPTYP
jgi:hypothetical protein